MVKIELIYVAEDQTNLHVQLNLEQGATVRDALMAAQLWTLYPETKDLPVGIYAKRVTEDTLLKDGDRLEIYRPLTLDPKEKRRLLARLKK